MTSRERALLARARFTTAPSVDLAVSGGPDSVGLWLLARAAGRDCRVHHVNHHLRPTSDRDEAFVVALGQRLGDPVEVHHVRLDGEANLEARARRARYDAMPAGVLTGHTMDDLAETMLLNLVRGAGRDGLAPMATRPDRPLLAIRRAELAAYVTEQGVVAMHDESNDDPRFVRNRLRHEALPLLNDIAERDVVELLARQADVLSSEGEWLRAYWEDQDLPSLTEADCRVLAQWPLVQLRYWLRRELRDPTGEQYPPSFDEVARAVEVVRGERVATELAGGRRLARREQRLSLE